MRAVLQPCRVNLDSRGKPSVLHWRKRAYPVIRVLGIWQMSERWWLQEPARTCWRLECGTLFVMVHHFERTAPPSALSGWWVARLQD